MTRIHRFGDLQLAILRVLWRRKEASAAEVQADLARERGLALSTIATTLKRLSAQGVVRHRSEGRHFLFSAVVGESDVRESMVSDLVKRLFRGDSAALVSHLVEAGEVEPGELDELRATVKRRARRGRKNDA